MYLYLAIQCHRFSSQISALLKSKLKLSNRLQQIDNMVTSGYHHIWDCCCDHGLLGCALLIRKAANNIHFVDIVPELMSELEQKLCLFYENSSWKTHCLNVTYLPLAKYEGKHLVIIAGIGGDLMIKFIEAIFQQYKTLNIDFLLCPVHHQYSLRQKLIALDFSLKDEVLVEDNQRFYEILLVTSSSENHCKIHPVGSNIWQVKSEKQNEVTKKYLKKTLNHYQRIQQGLQLSSSKDKINSVQHIINAYHDVSL